MKIMMYLLYIQAVSILLYLFFDIYRKTKNNKNHCQVYIYY